MKFNIFEKCFKGMNLFKSNSGKGMYFGRQNTNSEIKRRIILANIGENEYKIHFEICEIELSIKKRNIEAANMIENNATEGELLRMFNVIRDLKIETKNLLKQEKILNVAKTGVENNRRQKELAHVLKSTIINANTITESINNEQESLLNDFEKICNNSEISNNILESAAADAQEQIREREDDENSAITDMGSNMAFHDWKAQLQVEAIQKNLEGKSKVKTTPQMLCST